jgi:hypothetical protein
VQQRIVNNSLQIYFAMKAEDCQVSGLLDRAIAFATKSALKWETPPGRWKRVRENPCLVGCRSDGSDLKGLDVGEIIQMRLSYLLGSQHDRASLRAGREQDSLMPRLER